MNSPTKFWRKSDTMILWQIKDGHKFLDTSSCPPATDSWVYVLSTKPPLRFYDCDQENMAKGNCISFQAQLFRIRQILLLVLGKLLKKSQVIMEESNYFF